MSRVTVLRCLDEYQVLDSKGRELSSFRVGANGTAPYCAAEAHLVARWLNAGLPDARADQDAR